MKDWELRETLAVLRLRNTQLRMQQTIAELEISSLRSECANWKQIALAALEKARQLEQ